MRAATLLSIFLALATTLPAQTGIGYYDIDRLYDTVPSPFCNDSDYTPGGRYRWSAERYRSKVAATAAVIDSMALDIVALWGVENETVVRDIVAACREDYSYIHRTLNTIDGQDFALLYYGDRLYPSLVRTGRMSLYIEGELCGHRMGILLCSSQTAAEEMVAEMRGERPGVPMVALGQFGGIDPTAHGLRDITAQAERAGHGTARNGGEWEMHDRVLADTTLNTLGGNVFAQRFMLDTQSGNPLPTYDSNRYTGGISRSLPIFFHLKF